MALLTGCASEPTPATPDELVGRPTVEASPLRDAPLCRPGTTPAHLGALHLQLWHSPEVTPAAAAEVGAAAAAVWTRLGAVTTVAMKGTVKGDGLIEDTPAGPSLQPTKEVLAQLPVEAHSHIVHLVAMARFMPAQSTTASTGVSLRGLTVSDRMPPDPNGLLARLQLDGAVTPTAFINMSAGPRAPGDLSLAPAHEVGHALGLVHRSIDQALMSDGELSLRCLPGLSDAERSTVAGQLDGR